MYLHSSYNFNRKISYCNKIRRDPKYVDSTIYVWALNDCTMLWLSWVSSHTASAKEYFLWKKFEQQRGGLKERRENLFFNIRDWENFLTLENLLVMINGAVSRNRKKWPQWARKLEATTTISLHNFVCVARLVYVPSNPLASCSILSQNRN